VKHLMTRLFALAALALLALAAPMAQAFEFSTMTDAERNAFRAEVRSYLMENPEVLLEAIKVLENRQAAQQQTDDASLLKVNAEDIYNDGYSYIGGNPDGDVTLVEFSDYRCPYCRRAHPEVTELLKQDGNIRLIYKEYPILGDASLTSSRFAIATMMVAGPEAYKKVSDALIELRGEPSAEALKGIAEKFGLDAAEIALRMPGQEVTDIIDKNHALGQRLRISGTPSFILGDQFLRGYVPLADMQELVKQLRAKK